jgi:hypothetical protein
MIHVDSPITIGMSTCKGESMISMHPDAWQELSAMRHMISSMYCVVRDLADKAEMHDDDSVQHMHQAMKKWHKHRSERFDQEVRRAKEILEKWDQLCGA